MVQGPVQLPTLLSLGGAALELGKPVYARALVEHLDLQSLVPTLFDVARSLERSPAQPHLAVIVADFFTLARLVLLFARMAASEDRHLIRHATAFWSIVRRLIDAVRTDDGAAGAMIWAAIRRHCEWAALVGSAYALDEIKAWPELLSAVRGAATNEVCDAGSAHELRSQADQIRAILADPPAPLPLSVLIDRARREPL